MLCILIIKSECNGQRVLESYQGIIAPRSDKTPALKKTQIANKTNP